MRYTKLAEEVIILVEIEVEEVVIIVVEKIKEILKLITNFKVE